MITRLKPHIRNWMVALFMVAVSCTTGGLLLHPWVKGAITEGLVAVVLLLVLPINGLWLHPSRRYFRDGG